MTLRPFAPSFMPVGILTAALQELTPRPLRDTDPDLAIEDWLDCARDLGVDTIQLSAALQGRRYTKLETDLAAVVQILTYVTPRS